MDYGILRVSETETSEIEATKALVMINVTSEKILFGNAAMTASEDLKSIIDIVKTISEDVSVDTEAMSVTTNSGIFGKNSTANYTIKMTVNDLSSLGSILGICSEGKKISVRSVSWGYDEDEAKLDLIKRAIRKAKRKADEMMEEIGYSVIAIHSCSDSYQAASAGPVMLGGQGASQSDDTLGLAMRQPAPAVDFGMPFKSKKQISATCTMEFLIKEKS